MNATSGFKLTNVSEIGWINNSNLICISILSYRCGVGDKLCCRDVGCCCCCWTLVMWSLADIVTCAPGLLVLVARLVCTGGGGATLWGVGVWLLLDVVLGWMAGVFWEMGSGVYTTDVVFSTLAGTEKPWLGVVVTAPLVCFLACQAFHFLLVTKTHTQQQMRCGIQHTTAVQTVPMAIPAGKLFTPNGPSIHVCMHKS